VDKDSKHDMDDTLIVLETNDDAPTVSLEDKDVLDFYEYSKTLENIIKENNISVDFKDIKERLNMVDEKHLEEPSLHDTDDEISDNGIEKPKKEINLDEGSLKKENDTLSKQIIELQVRLSELAERNRYLETNQNFLKRNYSKLQLKHEDSKIQLNTKLKVNEEQKIKQNIKIQQKMTDLNQEKQKFQKENEYLSKELSKFEAENSKLEQDKTDLEDKVNYLKLDISVIQDTLELVQKQNNDILEQNRKLKEEVLAELQNNGHDSDAFDKIMQNVDLQTKCQNYEDERKKK